MNIFYTDPGPVQSALWLDDKRKNKMILESAQLLSTAVRMNGAGDEPVYASTHYNHPCGVWVRNSRANFAWLLEHMKALANKKHGPHASTKLLTEFDKFLDTGWFPLDQGTPHPNCAANSSIGVDFKHVNPTHKAYRLYLCERWRNDTSAPTWNWGEQPSWRTST